MIKKIPSKSQLRSEIERATEQFLKGGEKIDVIPKGISSRDGADGPLKPEPWRMEKSNGERTYLPEVIDTLEQRKQSKTASPPKTNKTKKPRKRLIYDDFGEPLRWVWVDE